MAEVRRLTSKNMSEKIADMEENSAEVRQFTRHNMAVMEEKAAEMDGEMMRKKLCMKAEMKEVKAEAYECLARER